MTFFCNSIFLQIKILLLSITRYRKYVVLCSILQTKVTNHMRLTQSYAHDRKSVDGFHEKAQLQNVMQKIQLVHIDCKKHSQQSQTERSYSAVRNLNYMKHVNKTSEKKICQSR
jgi:hypothetical protein